MNVRFAQVALCLIGLVSIATVTGCRPASNVGPPPAAPAFTAPAAVVPADLDLVVRIDLERLRSMLGSEIMTLVKAQALLARGGDDTELWVTQALELADTAWLGLRPASNGIATDNVLVLRGKFKALAEPPPAFEPPMDLGGGWKRYDRTGEVSRSAPARLYLRTDEMVVLVSEAEIDAVERTLEKGDAPPGLEPPNSGVLSLAARLHRLAPALQGRAPAAARLLSNAEQLELEVTLDHTELNAKAAVRFGDAEQARRTADAARIFVELAAQASQMAERLLEHLSIEAVGAEVILRIQMPGSELDALIACAHGDCE